MDPVMDPYRRAAADAVMSSLGHPGSGSPSGIALPGSPEWSNPGGAGGPRNWFGGPPGSSGGGNKPPFDPGSGYGGPGPSHGPPGTNAGGAMSNPQLAPPSSPQDPNVGMVNQHFQERLAALQDAVQKSGGAIYPFSMSRTPQEQEQLFRSAVDKYGDEKVARQYVSPAGTSRHEHNAGLRYGLGPGAIAADLRGDLAMASRLAAMYGLEFNDKNNPWHITLAGLK